MKKFIRLLLLFVIFGGGNWFLGFSFYTLRLYQVIGLTIQNIINWFINCILCILLITLSYHRYKRLYVPRT